MTFRGKKSEILPWLAIALIGAALGRNMCHHAGWPWWIGFTVTPVLVIVVGAGLNALIRRRKARRPGGRRRDSGPPNVP